MMDTIVEGKSITFKELEQKDRFFEILAVRL